MIKPLPIAHATRDADGNWRPPHDLLEHLHEVGELAADFARRYGADWARLAGRWHDLGKFRPRFQKYIRFVSGFEADAHIKGEAGKAPHSTAGALLACEHFEKAGFGPAGRVLAYLIAGHHAGLADWFGGLRERLEDPKSRAELDESLVEQPPTELLDSGDFKPDLRAVPGGRDGFALWIRMLFSALVDADFLDTERYMDPDRFASRNTWPTLEELAPLFDAHMTKLVAGADPTPVNALRADILRQCHDAAALDAGLFSLTVPTGGGKTLSGMAFALEHARGHSKRRIIHVIPYTSIIEQTADVFRDIFGDAVVEHHSNAESEPDKETSASRLACENWDAPIVVTTNVQFFESLFASRTSRCRKLHNIVDSVVILDEAQLLPPEFLQPILDVLNLLTRHYGVTVVLSTATQPALASREYFDTRQNRRGLDNVREIISDPDALYVALERVEVRLPSDWHQPTDWPQLTEALCAHESVLAIVNTRKDARALWEAMPQGTLHLSALMCGAHRSQVIADIKARLKAGASTSVVSTQLVEAGVDVDFPVVYRALAGLDSIAQAAGRCNREGRLKGKGEVVVFVPPEPAPQGLLRQGENACREVLRDAADSPLARTRFAAYFERLYYGCQLDKAGIRELLSVKDSHELAVDFRTAAEKFRLIDDEDSLPIVVRYSGKDGRDERIDQWLAMLRRDGPQRWLMRKLQRYTVSLRRRQVLPLLNRGDIEEILPGLYAQTGDGLYDENLGLLPEGKVWKAGDFVW
ncbi:CRISPR-associated endonuclease/helicase Cas3 [Steroidobacter denitrificans]|uniref:CRISPR-associated endonuclease/helicase Cas3 n=1 Tax=Steroidobacter denitrificans TaxID=465721 RepID=A0A127F4Z7_STEDE|nr:CRISPR-associated helicase/endonuclease Cas3 [Steroidobacter denitrificans]AMN45526.1 CRISPR-associated endonuclease/helicase Cas3 [Steroidobacter denitrificans]